MKIKYKQRPVSYNVSTYNKEIGAWVYQGTVGRRKNGWVNDSDCVIFKTKKLAAEAMLK